MSNLLTARRSGRLATAAVAFALLTGCSAASGEPQSAHSLDSTSASPSQGEMQPSIEPTEVSPDSLAVLPESAPTSVNIPTIDTSSNLVSLGLNEDGSVEVPSTEPGAPAGWYTGSPTPGERGPSIILGHVNADGGGPGVFAGLRTLEPNDLIYVTRADGSIGVFSFSQGKQYSKSNFPSELVYGDTSGAELRLITCDGFNSSTGEFDDNYVVYAELVSSI